MKLNQQDIGMNIDFWDTFDNVASAHPELKDAADRLDGFFDSDPDLCRLLGLIFNNARAAGYEAGKDAGYREREEWEDERQLRRDLERQFI